MSHLPLWTPKKKLKLMGLDAVVYALCIALVYGLRLQTWDLWILVQSLGFWFLILSVLTSVYIFGAYDFDEESARPGQLFLKVFFILGSALTLILFINYLGEKSRSGIFGRGVLLGSLFCFLCYLIASRAYLNRAFVKAGLLSEWLFVCSEKYLGAFQADLSRKPLLGKMHFASAAQALTRISEKNWNSVVLALDEKDLTETLGEGLIQTRFSGVLLHDLLDFYESTFRKVPLFYVGPRWFSLAKGFHLIGNPGLQRVKRFFDLILSLSLLAVVWPLMLLAAVFIRLESPGPVIYRQIRTGKNGKEFTITKFRSMRSDAEKNGAQWAAKNDSRVTRVGRFLRKTRIDELPQLFNIIKGDMSFIGPRPERPEFNHNLEKQIPFYNMRHVVRPGLTGWAQVCYPYGASIEDAKEKLQFDLYYIKNYSLFLDFIVILKTVRVVLFGSGQ